MGLGVEQIIAIKPLDPRAGPCPQQNESWKMMSGRYIYDADGRGNTFYFVEYSCALM